MSSKKIALVTGASGFVGEVLAKLLSHLGYTTVLHYHQNKSKVTALAREIRTQGGEAIYMQANLSDADDTARFFKAIRHQFGKLDLLINNAAQIPIKQHLSLTTDIEVESLFILDQEQDFDKLSAEVQDAILSLVDEFSGSDWE